MLELSKAVQRVIDVERNANEDLRKELATIKAAITAKAAAQAAREVRHAHVFMPVQMLPVASSF